MERSRKKSPLKILIWLILFFGLVALGVWFYWNSLIAPLDSNSQTRAFVVTTGQSVSQIADRLEKEKIIRSAMGFKILYKLQGTQPKIDIGDFKLSSNMSTQDIINTLQKGSVDKWVRLVEGWRVEEEAKEIEKATGIKQADFLKHAKEGYMFPDSYLINPNAAVTDIVSLLENTFEQKYSQELRKKIKDLGLTEEEGVILASIIEREARTDEVRTQVASILLKRFNLGMALNADATVQYAKDSNTLKAGKKVDKFWQPITVAEYRSVVSTYNTYLHPGLPPAPICNPSVSSLRAVANANPSTPYLFYYHDSQGNSHYARTLEEHTANVAKYK